MARIAATVDIARSADDVFAYVTDSARYVEWQRGAIRGDTLPQQGSVAIGVGSLVTMTRRVGGVERTSTSEITAYDPPRHWAIHGIDTPLRANVWVTVEAIDATSARATIEIEFFGHGLGKILVPFVNSQARREMPQSCRSLKERMESKTSLSQPDRSDGSGGSATD
jgi:hypothetical protein